MNPKNNSNMQIFELAMDCYKNPGAHVKLLRGQTPLPDGLEFILSLASKSQKLNGENETVNEEHDAAHFFIESVLLSNNPDFYRILGITRDADSKKIKAHHRLLIRIYHPDRIFSPDDWSNGFAARINTAYSTLIHENSRRQYDKDHPDKNQYLTSEVSILNQNQPKKNQRKTKNHFHNSFFFRHPSSVIFFITVLISIISIIFVYSSNTSFSLASYEEIKPDPELIHIGKPKAVFHDINIDTHTAPLQEAALQKQIPSIDNLQQQDTSTKTLLNKITESTNNLSHENTKLTTNINTAKALDVIEPAKTQRDIRVPKIEMKTGETTSTALPPPPSPPKTQNIIVEKLPPLTHNKVDVISNNSTQSETFINSKNQESISKDDQSSLEQEYSIKSKLEDVLQTFKTTYQNGNIFNFMAIFDTTVVTEGGGKDFIRHDYTRLFTSSSQRSINFYNVKFEQKRNFHRIDAMYKSAIIFNDTNEPSITHGRIQLDVSLTKSTSSITSIYYTTENN